MRSVIVVGALLAVSTFTLPMASADNYGDTCLTGSSYCYCVSSHGNSCYDDSDKVRCQAAVGLTNESMKGVLCDGS